MTTEEAAEPFDPIGSECEWDEQRDRHSRPLGFGEDRKRSMTNVHSANPTEHSIEYGEPQPGRNEREPNRAQYGRAGLLFFCAHSSHSVALAWSRTPHAPQRL